jgi:PAS domain-containing protein
MEFQLNSLLPHWPGVVFQQRPDMSLERAEGQLEELTGCSAARWGSEPGLFWKLLHELDEEPFRLELGRIRPGGEGVRQRFRLRHPVSGRVRHVSEFRRAEADSGGGLSGYEGFWLDVSRETLAERRLAGAAW